MLATAAFVAAGCVSAQEGAQQASGFDFDAGADVRFRYEVKDNWMDKGKTTVSPEYEDYCRARLRAWGKATSGEDYGTYLRLADEFRGYHSPS